MENKIKKISINALEKCVKEAAGEPIVTKEWRGINVNIKVRLGLKEMMTFVDGVVKTCFTEDDNQYTPEVLDFAIRSSVLEMYANFTLPSNIEKQYELVYGCDVYSTILEAIDRSQFDAMLRAIDEKISHIAASNIEAVTRQVNDVYASLNALEERLSAVFQGIDKDAITGLVGAMADGKFDEEKLVQAYLETKNGKKLQEDEAGE